MLICLSREYTRDFCVEYYKVLVNAFDANGEWVGGFVSRFTRSESLDEKLQIHLSETRSVTEVEFACLEFVVLFCLILDELTSL
jgi:hypothetical protein